jgi:hypothetical protein
VPGSGIVVVDRLMGRGRDAVSRLHLAPGVEAAAGRIGPLSLQTLGDGGEAVVGEDRHSPSLGTQVAARMVARAAPHAPGSPFGWALLRPGHRAELHGDRVVVTRPGGEALSRAVG